MLRYALEKLVREGLPDLDGEDFLCATDPVDDYEYEFFIKHSKLPIEPFRLWLQNQCQAIGITNVARSIGVDPRRIGMICAGRYYNTPRKKWYEMKYVQLATVDTYTVAMGYSWSDLYPDLYQRDEKP